MKGFFPLALLAIAAVPAARASSPTETCPDPEQTRDCSVEHGMGREACVFNADLGKHVWNGVCEVIGCDSGYGLLDNKCQDLSAARKSEGATETPVKTEPIAAGAPPPASQAKNADYSSTNSGSQRIESSANTMQESQSGSLEASQKVVSLGANQAATAGAVYCAEAANFTLEGREAAAESARACQDKFAAAEALAALNRRAGQGGEFSVDKDAAGHEGADAVLGAFEKNFGIGREEYLSRMLKARGGLSEFRNLLGSALPDGKLDATLAAAEGLERKADEKNYEVSFGSAKKKGPVRDQLKAALAQAALAKAKQQKAAEARAPANAKGEPMMDLEALSAKDAFQLAEPATLELTIFDVVKRKYRELAVRLHRR